MALRFGSSIYKMTLARMVECIPPDMCDQIIEAAEESEFHRSTVIRNGGLKIDSIRSNYNTHIPYNFKDEVSRCLNKAVSTWSNLLAETEYKDVLCLPGVTPDLNTYFETPSLLRYENNQNYEWHCDGKPFADERDTLKSHERLISIVCYLNDNFEGGETKVMEVPYKPIRGKALVFPSNWCYPHCAMPVTSGAKYCITTWYHAT